MGGIEPWWFRAMNLLISPFFLFILACLGVRVWIRCLFRCLVVVLRVVCGGGLLVIVGRGVEVVEGGHEVGVDLRLLGLQVFLIAFQHVVGGVTHALHLILLRDVEG